MTSIVVVEGQDTTPPEILSTYPNNQEFDIPLNASIYVNFSEPMNPNNASWDIQPYIILSDAWGMGISLILSHTTPFDLGTKYTVTVNGTDLAGNWLDGNNDGIGGDAYSWSFATDCGGLCIIETYPADGKKNVSLTDPVVVIFNQAVDTSSVNLLITIHPEVPFLGSSWGLGNTNLLIDHSPFSLCTVYTVRITDPSGSIIVPGPVPNPWSFTTTGCNPIILYIKPPQNNASLDSPIQIDFNVPMNMTTVKWLLKPEVILTPSWNIDNTTLNLTHDENFIPCTNYTLTLNGNDTQGRNLEPGPVPNPYNFTTICTYPRVIETSPYRNQNDVALDAPVIITFSETMDNESVENSFSYMDDRMVLFTKSDGMISWSENFTIFTFMPNTPYRRLVTYTVKLDANIACGLGNNHLDGNYNGVPEGSPNDDYTWQFTTIYVIDNILPYIVSVDPANGAQDVPRNTAVVIVFSEAMNKSSVYASLIISEGRTAYNFSWSNNMIINFNIIPNPIYSLHLTIVVRQTAADLIGNQMQQDYSWSFTIEQWRGYVYGSVVDDEDDSPITNATVTLNGIETLTDVNGNFTLRGISQGSYRLNISKEGYHHKSILVTIGLGFQDLGIIELERITQTEVFSEVPLGIILGIILTIIIVLLILILLLRHRRKVQPTKFEDWKGEVAVVERFDDEL